MAKSKKKKKKNYNGKIEREARYLKGREREREREREMAEGERLWGHRRSCGCRQSMPYGGHQLADLSIDEGQRGARLRTEE